MRHQASCVEVIIHDIVGDWVAQMGWERCTERSDDMIQFNKSGGTSGIDGVLWTLKGFIDIVYTCNSRVTGKMFGSEAKVECLNMRCNVVLASTFKG